MKLTEIEYLLNLNREADIHIYGVSTETLMEAQRIYGGSIGNNPNNSLLTIQSGNIYLTLNTITFKK